MSILKSSFIFSIMTALSRVLGFVRDVVIANRLGVSAASDAFFVALLLPNLLRRIFAEGAFNVAFVPILTSLTENKTKEEAERFASIALTILLLILTVIIGLGEIYMYEVLTYLVAPGWAETNPEKLALTVPMAQITFPYLMLITVASLMGGVCNTYSKFGPYAFVPVLFNIAIIACLIILPVAGISSHMAASIAVPIGGVLQVGFMWWFIRKIDFKVSLTSHLSHPEIKPLFIRLGPAALAVGILQISFLIDTWFASNIADEAVSYLQYANRFYQFPLALIGVTLSTVLLPHFSRSLAKGDRKEADRTFADALLYGTALALASMAGLMMLADDLIGTMFGHGKFTAENAMMTARTMQAYCVGLPALVATKITITAFYANKDTKTPMIISMLALTINIGLNFLLVDKFSYVGLALATGLTAWANVMMQFLWLKSHDFIGISQPKQFLKDISKSLIATIVMMVMIELFSRFVPYADIFVVKMIWLMGAGILGISSFALIAHITGFFDAKALFKALRKKAI